MTVRFTLVFAFVLIAGLGSQAGAAVSPAFAFALPKAPHRLAADPSLSDPAWQAGKVPGDAAWWNVTARRPADDATTVYLLYDDKSLYAGFISEQRSAPIVATLNRLIVKIRPAHRRGRRNLSIPLCLTLAMEM